MSRIPADKTLETSVLSAGILLTNHTTLLEFCKRKKCFKKRCKMIGGSDWIQLFQLVKTNYIDILWCHKEFGI